MIKDMKKQTKFYNTPDAPKPNRPIHMGAVGIIRNNGRVLLERRTDADRWAFIGGGLKMEESLEECVQREVREETGLWADSLKLLNVFSYPYRIAAYPDGNIVRIITAVYEVFIKDFQGLCCSEESRELRFFETDELSGLTIAETHKDILEYYMLHFA